MVFSVEKISAGNQTASNREAQRFFPLTKSAGILLVRGTVGQLTVSKVFDADDDGMSFSERDFNI